MFEPKESIADADSANSTHAGKRLRDQTNDGGKTIDGNICGEDRDLPNHPDPLSSRGRPYWTTRARRPSRPRSAAIQVCGHGDITATKNGNVRLKSVDGRDRQHASASSNEKYK